MLLDWFGVLLCYSELDWFGAAVFQRARLVLGDWIGLVLRDWIGLVMRDWIGLVLSDSSKAAFAAPVLTLSI